VDLVSHDVVSRNGETEASRYILRPDGPRVIIAPLESDLNQVPLEFPGKP
jgi:hypothetical protein